MSPTAIFHFQFKKGVCDSTKACIHKTMSVLVSAVLVFFSVVSAVGNAAGLTAIETPDSPDEAESFFPDSLYVNFFDANNVLISKKLLTFDENSFARLIIEDIIADDLEGELYFMGWSTERFTDAEDGGGQSSLQTPQNTVSFFDNGCRRSVLLVFYRERNGVVRIYERDKNCDDVDAECDSDFFTTTVSDDGSISFYAEYEKAHWLMFTAGETGWGAAYVPSDHFLVSEPVSELPGTTRPGYVFDGWCLGRQDENGVISYLRSDLSGYTAASESAGGSFFMITQGEASDGNGAVSVITENKRYEENGSLALEIKDGRLYTYKNITLYGKWSPKSTASFRVAAWRQKASDSKYALDDDKQYDYYGCMTVNAPASKRISELSGEEWGEAERFFHLDETPGFELFKAARTVSSELERYPDPQGTTTVNVYYDRKIVTMDLYTYRNDYTYTETAGTTQPQYAFCDDRYVRLDKGIGNNWYLPDGTQYTGTRYKMGRKSVDWHLYRQFTGLYGSSLEKNGYTWPQEYSWYAKGSAGGAVSGTKTTFLDAFILSDGSEKRSFYGSAASGGHTIHFLKEQLNGEYIEANRVYSGSGRFNISDKYSGFYASQYSLNGTDYIPVGVKDPATGYYGGDISFHDDLYIRFGRSKDHKLIFDPNYPGEASFSPGTHASGSEVIDRLMYEYPLSGFREHECAFTAPEHYSFAGWYADKSCSKPFDFDSEIMPDGNKVVFAKWYPDHYLVTIDPNGGTLAGEDAKTQSSYFWLQYGSAIGRYSITRNYMPTDKTIDMISRDSDKYYRYRSVVFTGFEHTETYYGENGEKAFGYYSIDPDNAAESALHIDNEGIKPSHCRQAEYISLDKFRTPQDKFFENLKTGFLNYINNHSEELNYSALTEEQKEAEALRLAEEWDDRYTTDKTAYTLISEENGAPQWVLVGWDKITERTIDGKTMQIKEPYNFTDPVTENVTLRARWRQSGKYVLVYHSDQGVVVGTFSNGESVLYDPIIHDGSGGAEGYADGADAPVINAPNDIHGAADDNNNYIFEGWRIVYMKSDPVTHDVFSYPVDEHGAMITDPGQEKYYKPGEVLYVRHEQASDNGYIHLEAVYSPDAQQLLPAPTGAAMVRITAFMILIAGCIVLVVWSWSTRLYS